MKTVRQDSARTRSSLLSAASEVFAEKGYRDATIAEISERAGTNVASVNYHFGDKETLYREAWRQSFRESIEMFPPDGGVPNGASAQQRLRGRVVALARRITNGNNRAFLIAYKELANPTGLLEEVMHKEIDPLRQKIEGLVSEMLGENSTIQQARYCATSIMSQCVIPAFMNRIQKPHNDTEKDSWRIEDIEGYVDHVVDFSLAGIRNLRGRRIKELQKEMLLAKDQKAL